MLKYFDSHSHLQFPAYDIDRAKVVERMKEKSVGTIIVGTNFITSEKAITLSAELGENFYSSVAVHPSHVFSPHYDKNELNEAPSEEMFDAAVFSKLIMPSKKVVAVGECGLDYFRLENDLSFKEIRKRQIENFLRHIDFSKNNSLPLIIHSRAAHKDTLEILKSGDAKNARGVMHCFSGTAEEARQYLELGFYVSITCAVTYGPRKGETDNPLHEVAKFIPLDRLLTETDAPYLSPLTLRGLRNEPANVVLAVKKIAELRCVDEEKIAAVTYENARRLFCLAD